MEIFLIDNSENEFVRYILYLRAETRTQIYDVNIKWIKLTTKNALRNSFSQWDTLKIQLYANSKLLSSYIQAFPLISIPTDPILKKLVGS